MTRDGSSAVRRGRRALPDGRTARVPRRLGVPAGPAPEYDQEFQIADLDELGRQRPLVVGLDFTPDNVTGIVAALPTVRGIALTLADGVRRDDVHVHSYAEALRIVQSAVGR